MLTTTVSSLRTERAGAAWSDHDGSLQNQNMWCAVDIKKRRKACRLRIFDTPRNCQVEELSLVHGQRGLSAVGWYLASIHRSIDVNLLRAVCLADRAACYVQVLNRSGCLSKVCSTAVVEGLAAVYAVYECCSATHR
jgi:hypothetical protein